MSARVFRLLVSLYPRAWRKRYSAELEDLCDEFLDSGEIARWRLAANIVASASVEQLRSWLRLSRRLALGGGASAVVVLAIIAAVTNGFGSFDSALPTKGPVPMNANVNGHIDLNRVPDFVSVESKGHVVGFSPKADLFPSPRKGVHLGPELPPVIEPVYGPDLKTLVGHLYPGEGFVSVGSRPTAAVCVPITAVANDEAESVPCGSVAVDVPDVVGMYTPTGVAKLSGLGLNIQIVNVKSGQVMPGHIVSTSPNAGASVAARSVITVDISVRV